MDNGTFMKIFNSNTLVDFDYAYRKTNDYDTRLNNLNKIFNNSDEGESDEGY